MASIHFHHLHQNQNQNQNHLGLTSSESEFESESTNSSPPSASSSINQQSPPQSQSISASVPYPELILTTPKPISSPSMIHPIYADSNQINSTSSSQAYDHVTKNRSMTSYTKTSPPVNYTSNKTDQLTTSSNENGNSNTGNVLHQVTSNQTTPQTSNIRPFYTPPTLSSLPKSATFPLGLTNHQQPSPYLKQIKRQDFIYKRLDSSTAWLIYYFSFNLGLTIYNKKVLLSFPFPWTLTGIHALSSTLGSQLALNRGIFKTVKLNKKDSIILLGFSVLYTINIAVSNLSLHLVTVPFHQVVRATTPLFTILLSIIYLKKSYSIQTYFSLLILIIGVGFSTYGDYGWTKLGLILTLLGTILASIKTIITNLIQVGKLKLNPLDLLLRMSPLAFIQCVIWSYWTGEMDRVRIYGANEMNKHKAIALIFNGFIAFGLNVVSFTANKKTSALTMTVAANVKQVLTIVLAVFIFNLVITPTNLFGITLTLLGGAYYAKVELDRKVESSISLGTVKKDEGIGAEKVGLPR